MTRQSKLPRITTRTIRGLRLIYSVSLTEVDSEGYFHPQNGASPRAEHDVRGALAWLEQLFAIIDP